MIFAHRFNYIMNLWFDELENSDYDESVTIVNGKQVYSGCFTAPAEVIAASIPRPKTPFHCATIISSISYQMPSQTNLSSINQIHINQ